MLKKFRLLTEKVLQWLTKTSPCPMMRCFSESSTLRKRMSQVTKQAILSKRLNSLKLLTLPATYTGDTPTSSLSRLTMQIKCTSWAMPRQLPLSTFRLSHLWAKNPSKFSALTNKYNSRSCQTPASPFSYKGLRSMRRHTKFASLTR